MSDIAGVAGQLFQQIAEKQSVSQPIQSANGKSFESYLQQDKTLQSPVSSQPAAAADAGKIQTNLPSGTGMDAKLQQLQTDLANSHRQSEQIRNEYSKTLTDMLDNKTRLSLLKEAAAHVQQSPNTTKDFTGRLVQLENNYNEVEAIMRSDKNLSSGELLALQARLYQVSQHVEVMSKVVDQMAGGIKTVLNTNV